MCDRAARRRRVEALKRSDRKARKAAEGRAMICLFVQFFFVVGRGRFFCQCRKKKTLPSLYSSLELTDQVVEQDAPGSVWRDQVDAEASAASFVSAVRAIGSLYACEVHCSSVVASWKKNEKKMRCTHKKRTRRALALARSLFLFLCLFLSFSLSLSVQRGHFSLFPFYLDRHLLSTWTKSSTTPSQLRGAGRER